MCILLVDLPSGRIRGQVPRLACYKSTEPDGSNGEGGSSDIMMLVVMQTCL